MIITAIYLAYSLKNQMNVDSKKIEKKSSAWINLIKIMIEFLYTKTDNFLRQDQRTNQSKKIIHRIFEKFKNRFFKYFGEEGSSENDIRKSFYCHQNLFDDILGNAQWMVNIFKNSFPYNKIIDFFFSN